MGKNYFHFKQFSIQQRWSGLKVCSDACVFGATVSFPDESIPLKVLEVGTGTGLLPLMLAQRFEQGSITITTVEIFEPAFTEAKANIESSKFANRINCQHQDVREYSTLAEGERFNWLVSNPPFFVNSLKGNNLERSIAMHQETLTSEDIFNLAERVLSPEGVLSLMYPPTEMQIAKEAANKSGYFVISQTNYYHSEGKAALREFVNFSKQKSEADFPTSDFFLFDADGNYTKDAFRVLKPFYATL